MSNRQPLVTIIVITYNSSKYVLETLESAKRQTYQNVELIISDDGSKDETISLCQDWLKVNTARFVRAELLTVDTNSGIPANCNRGVQASRGEWLKLIAGDDLLVESCIAGFVEFSTSNPSALIIESATQFFRNTFSPRNFTKIHNLSSNLFFDPETTAEQQYQLLLRDNYLHGSSSFIRRDKLLQIGGYDERFRFIEDYPLWLNLTKAGNKIYFHNNITVYYRLHNESVFSSRDEKKIFSDFYLKVREFENEYIYPNIPRVEGFFRNIYFYQRKIFDTIGFNRNYLLYKLLDRILFKINPWSIFVRINLRLVGARRSMQSR